MSDKNLNTFWAGLLSIIIAAVILFSLQPAFFLVLEIIESSIKNVNSALLILAGGLYSLSVTAGAVPLMLGSFMVSDVITRKWSHRLGGEISFGVNLLTAAALYFLVFRLAGFRPNIFIPVIVTGFIFLAAAPRHRRLKIIHRGTITFQLLLGCYWLNLSPFLGRFGWGRDEIAVSIKLSAAYLNSGPVMSFISMSFFIPLVLIAVITSVLINNYYRQIKQIEAAKQKEKELQRYRLQSIQARSLQEMHSLVHDLKTPLMTINGLCSLLEMKYLRDEKDREYFRRIDRSVTSMNEMISEILHENVKRVIGVPELINYVQAQIIPEKTEQEVNFHVEDGLPRIKVNRVRFARALINLLENALEATGGMENGRIDIVAGSDSGRVRISVTDNGVGISPENLDKIWETGFSTGNSSGLGLPFVKKVIEDHGGVIEVSSRAGEGTTFTIYLRGEEAGDRCQ